MCLFCGTAVPPTAQRAPSHGARPAVGEVLRSARLRERISIDEAALDTHIQTSYLEALENDDVPDQYPGTVYVRFFLTEYAEYLGVDPGPLVATFDRELGGRARASTAPPSAVRVGRRTVSWSVAAVISATLLVAGIVATRPGRSPSTALRAVASQAAVTGAWPAAADAPPPRGSIAGDGRDRADAWTPTDEIHAVVAATQPSRLEPVIDGQPQPTQVMGASETLHLQADRSLDLSLTDSGRAVVRVDGRRVALRGGGIDSVSLVLRHGRVIQR